MLHFIQDFPHFFGTKTATPTWSNETHFQFQTVHNLSDNLNPQPSDIISWRNPCYFIKKFPQKTDDDSCAV